MKDTIVNSLSSVRRARCFCGFDGFVDEVVHVVDRRFNAEEYSRVMTLPEYGKRIAAGSGLSINVEIVPVGKKLGGNGPIFAAGLKRLGADITYVGCVGKEAIDPVFSEMSEGAELIGIADPGRTDAMEFSDGKIIRSKLSSLNDVTWENLLAKVGLQQLIKDFDRSDMISFNNWTMLPHMTGIWDGILKEAIPRMQGSEIGKKLLFFDLADPEKRTKEDILGALDRLKAFHKKGFYTILGLNKKEACEISEVLGRPVPDYRGESLKALTEYLFSKLGLSCLVIHPVDCSACMTDDGYFEAAGPYCAKPKLTTGAGDNFNAGFVFGFLQGLDPSACLRLGMAASGFYVRNCHSPNIEEIRGFLIRWEEGALDQDS
jgi:sugar/nucleoside kinase (ribokinase family)